MKIGKKLINDFDTIYIGITREKKSKYPLVSVMTSDTANKDNDNHYYRSAFRNDSWTITNIISNKLKLSNHPNAIGYYIYDEQLINNILNNCKKIDSKISKRSDTSRRTPQYHTDIEIKGDRDNIDKILSNIFFK